MSGRLAQLARAFGSHPRGRWFKSTSDHHTLAVNYINESMVSRQYLVSTNPARGYEEIGRVRISTDAEIIEAVARAKNSRWKWQETSLKQRITHFKRLTAILQKRSRAMAELITLEVGKPITESLSDVEFDVANINSKIKLAPVCLAPEVLDRFDGQKNVLYYEPHGVVAVITPWNYPSSNFFISCAQLLLAGNVVIHKHSEECPLTGQLLAEIMSEAGFPEGVFTEVYGDGRVGDKLTDQNIDAIHFTGSSKVGQLLYQKAAEKFIPLVLEMGGSSPGIMFAGADLSRACIHAGEERFNNCGQICCALKRLIVEDSIMDSVVTEMKRGAEALVVGDPMKKTTQVGPLVAKRQLDLLVEQVEDAKNKGATIVTGGETINGLDGAFFQPTVITGVTDKMRVMTEEVFGPVLPIISFASEKEAIKIANNTIYGLSAYIYGRDIKRLHQVAQQIDAGQISINGASYFSDHSPFGGYKLSGIGRNDGKLGFYEATQKKVIAEPVVE